MARGSVTYPGPRQRQERGKDVMDQAQRTYTFATRLAGAMALRVVIVGLGGTGYHLLHHLLGIFYALEDARVAGVPLPEHALGRLPLSLALVDPDTVESKNVGRQKWRPADVGQFKAKAAAAYCAREYGIRAEYHVRHFADTPRIVGSAGVTLLISCVDNAAARRSLHDLLDNRTVASADRDSYRRPRERRFILVDCGNERDTGQVFVGTTMDRDRLAGAFSPIGLVGELPAAGLLDPGLLVDAAPGPRLLGPDGDDCAARVLRGEQSITINTHVAAMATQLVADLLLGTLRALGGFIDAQTGVKSTPVALSPRNMANLVSGYTEDPIEMGLIHGMAAPTRPVTRGADHAQRERVPATAIIALGHLPGPGPEPGPGPVDAAPSSAPGLCGRTTGEIDACVEAAPPEEVPSPRAERATGAVKKRRVRSHRADARAAGQAPGQGAARGATGRGAGGATAKRTSDDPAHKPLATPLARGERQGRRPKPVA